jgi:Dihydrodipicolinate reductase
MVKIAISGASGRMGVNLIKACQQNKLATLGVAIEREGSPVIGKEVGDVAGLASQPVQIISDYKNSANEFDVLIDFTRPEACLEKLAFCQANNKAMVIGTTGFTDEEKTKYRRLQAQYPLCLRRIWG